MSTYRSTYPNFNVLIAGLLFAYVAAFFLQLGIRVESLGAIRFEFLVAGVLVALALVYKDGVDYPTTGIKKPLAIFIICLAIQVPLSVNVAHSWVVFVDRVLKFSAMAFIISRFVNSPRMLFVLLAAFLLACLKMGQEGFVGNLSGNLVWQNQGVMRLHGSTPNYMHPNSFAGMAVGTLPFIYYLYPVLGKYLKAVLLVLLVLSVNIIIFTASRTAYVATIGMLAYVFWASNRKLKIAIAALVVAAAALALVPEQYQGRFESIFTGEEAEGRSSEARLQIIEDAFYVLARHPFGVGVGAFPEVRERYFGRTQDTHNLYLEVATNLGVQGLLAFLFVIWALIRSLRRSARSLQAQRRLLCNRRETEDVLLEASAKRHARNLKIFSAVCDATVAYVVVRLLLGIFGMDLYEIYWWFAIGIAIAMAKMTHLAAKETARYCPSREVD